MNIKEELISWYRAHKRDLPWRETALPYRIWLSEIILQQTRVSQGLPYYEAFVSKFPTVSDLANAHEDDVMLTWQGLGYYSRARNLHATAKYVANELNGRFPDSYAELLKLKGVGEYTAAAIASFCYNETVPVIDGNVYRVLSRFFGIAEPIDSSKGKKLFKALAEELIDGKNPAEYNQAIMEFGAIQCVPKSPTCENCPLNKNCVAHAENKIANLPVKKNKTKVTRRFLNYFFITEGENLFIERREENDIWQNLYQLPLIEGGKDELSLEIINDWLTENFVVGSTNFRVREGKTYKHVLSHQILRVTFWIVSSEKLFLSKQGKRKKIALENLQDYGMPRVITRFFDQNNLKELTRV